MGKPMTADEAKTKATEFLEANCGDLPWDCLAVDTYPNGHVRITASIGPEDGFDGCVGRSSTGDYEEALEEFFGDAARRIERQGSFCPTCGKKMTNRVYLPLMPLVWEKTRN